MKLVFAVFLAIVFLFPLAAEAKKIPLNPAFIKWRQQQQDNTAEESLAEPLADLPDFSDIPVSVHKLTGRPAPVNYEHLKNRSIVPSDVTDGSGEDNAAVSLSDTELPLSGSGPEIGLSSNVPTESTFDLRDYGYVSPVRDQDPYGSCWAFAAMSCMESTALQKGWRNPDFSEKHLAYYAYADVDSNYVSFDWLSNSSSIYDIGGNTDIASAILSRWTGAVSEQDVPYADMGPCDGDPTLPPGTVPPANATDESLLGTYRVAPGGTRVVENIKFFLKNYGVVYIAVRYEDEYYNEATYGFYNHDVDELNHLVAVVGWDDTYSRDNFNTTPSADGAWIVRNSWGADWGDEGYFYVSYEDVTVVSGGGAVYFAEPVKKGSYQYLYDYLGHISDGIAEVQKLWLANIFTAAASHYLDMVGFYVADNDNSYVISVYEGVDENAPASGKLAYQSEEVVFNSPGYFWLELPQGILVEAGKRFSIVLQVGSESSRAYYSYEEPVSGYSSKATAEAGQGFVSLNGSEWEDVTDGLPDTNLCIRAIADPGEEPVTPVNTYLLSTLP